MPWFKVDDDLPFHRKVVKAGNSAMGLWVRAGAWSSQQLTDGFVPDAVVDLLGTLAQRRKLVAAELWVEVEGGVMFYGWNKNGRQPTAQSVRETRASTARRQQEFRDRKTGRFSANSQVNEPRNAVSHTVSHGVSHTVSNAVSNARPDPTRSKELKDLATADAAPDTDEGFAEFWAAYPRKEKKPTAARAYKTLRRRRITHDTIMAGLRRHTTAWQAAGKERQYIPHPASWLNSEAFNDDLEQTALTVVPAFETSFDQIRAEADAEYAGRVINRWYVEPAQPPSDPTPQQCWTRDRAVEFIDAHETAIRAALPAPRRTG